MNYYRRYMGDYAKKTASLSLAEHGAYTLLLDELYSTENPLPGDYESLFRLCRAMTRAEQDAVRSVSDRFFPVGHDGLRRNQRAEEEIGIAKPAIEASRTNGVRGGRPRRNPAGFTDKTVSDPGGVQPPTTNPQPPATTPQKPSARKSSAPDGADSDPASKDSPVVLPEWWPQEAWARYVAHRKAKRAKLTPEAIRLIVKALDAHRGSVDPAAVLDLSVQNGWTGVFPDRMGSPQTNANGSGRPGVADRNRAARDEALRRFNEEGDGGATHDAQ